MDDVLYHLYLLYARKGMPSAANTYIARLKSEYPQSQWTTLLSDPYYVENSRFGVHIEDSLYTASYESFKAGKYDVVKANEQISATRFPMGANRDKFLFVGGLSKLNAGDAQGCVADMKTIVEKYPEGRICELAGMIVNGVDKGKRLRGGRFDLENVWAHRSAVLNEKDESQAKSFSDERNVPYVFLLAYQPDSVNGNQLLFEMAKFNFTTYLVRNFDINVEEIDGLCRMSVKGFRSYDEAVVYAYDVLSQTQITRLLGKSRAIVVSEQNLALLGTQFTYDEYAQYYNKHFLPLKSFDRQLLAEPTEIVVPQEEPKTVGGNEDLEDIGDMEEGEVQPKAGTIIVPEETVPTTPQEQPATTVAPENVLPDLPQEDNTVSGQNPVVTEEKQPDKSQAGSTTVIPEEPVLDKQPSGSTVTEIPEQPQQTDEGPLSGKQNRMTEIKVEEPEEKSAPLVKEVQGEEPKTKDVQTEKPQAKKTHVEEPEEIDSKAEELKAKEKTKEEKKQESYDLDDEYFELDGF